MILGRIWNNWAPKQSIVKAARRVGVTSSSLNVNDMQQDKFIRAATCIDTSDGIQPSTSTPARYTIESPDKRRNSAQYWKAKFGRSQELIQELSEKSIQLEEIPGLLTVQKVKPKMTKVTTRVTQVHGSMKGKNVLEMVKVIQDKKDQELKDKEERKSGKEKQKETFLLCKNECNCGQSVCDAIKLQQCSSCHNVQRSACGKSSCKVDGKKPIMFLAAAVSKNSLKRKLIEDESDEDESSIDENDEDDEDDEDNEDDEDEFLDDNELARTKMIATWKSLSPPIKEDDLIGKWFAAVYAGKKR